MSIVLESVDEMLESVAPLGRVEGNRFVAAAGEPDDGLVDRLAHTAAFGGTPEVKGTARWVLRSVAAARGIRPASIHDLYMAMGRREVGGFTVPAMNIRMMTYDTARAAFRAAKSINAGALIFEIARSEIGYTEQRPHEYAAVVTAAALRERYDGLLFFQGDHVQVNAKKYASPERDKELDTLRALIVEEIAAGFYNIDIDTSTLVDLSKETVPEQQALNAQLSAAYTKEIRAIQPANVTVSVGGEIGEVGGRNSTEEELRAYADGYAGELQNIAPDATGLSKISIQTGTSHGGVVLPDGSVAEVSVDFDTLKALSRVARKEYRLAGAVQHGASTLPQEAFGKFVEAEACEVHLATNFQNMLYERLPGGLRDEMYAYLDEHHAAERKPDMTPEQFYYKTRKNAIGRFKKELWGLDDNAKGEICQAWEAQFEQLFTLLAIAGTRKYVDEHVTPVKVQPQLDQYVKAGGEKAGEDVSDLAD